MRKTRLIFYTLSFLAFFLFTFLSIQFWFENYHNPFPDWYPPELPINAATQKRGEYVKEAFVHSFNGYKQYAWGHDEVRPVTGSPRNTRNGWAATIVDSLDTMILMNLTKEYKLSRELVSRIDFKKTYDLVNVFETTIRYIGGLLSAYDLTSDNLYLDKAIELAVQLLPAFDTPTGIPLQYVNLKKKTGVHSRFPGSASALAEFGSVQLEFRRLSELSGNPIFLDKAQRVIDILQSKSTELPGLYPVYMDPLNGKFTTSWVTWGGLGDSFYEYLLKHYIMVEGTLDQYLDMWLLAIDSTQKYLISTGYGFSNMTYLNQWWEGQPYYEMSHLACFAPGNFLLGGHILKNDTLIELGLNLTYTCYQSYESTDTKIGAEIFAYVDASGTRSRRWNRKQRNSYLSTGIFVTDGHYYLRPEVIESIFYAYRITGDKKYQDWGWNVFRAINKYCKTPIGFSGIRDVTSSKGGWDNIAESFWYGETLKYLYLLFNEDLLPLDRWVLNTEAHPFRIGGKKPASSRQNG
ncbi:2784_t:CDS:10 [Ambispora gerdemannii]|uniref:alpha-1,2-Mannosidase n=1 Tax=Ambispora gerdemannii TaxID=144530 RepID=A0A9N9BBZ9_9GLOM|nr:2784_t:CDS:10 [Ambispora gerdemannii]